MQPITSSQTPSPHLLPTPPRTPHAARHRAGTPARCPESPGRPIPEDDHCPDGAPARAVPPCVRRAFDQLVEQYYPPMLRHLTRQTGDAELAADLTQETFLDAWRDLERLADGRPAAPWLYRIARNNLLPHWRRRQPVSLDGLAAEDGAEPRALRQADPTPACDERALIAQVLADLSAPLQEALLLHCQQGLTSEEVGQVLAISGEAARKRIGRAKAQFRHQYRAAC